MKEFWNKLGGRQKKTVIAGAVVLALIIIVQFVFFAFHGGQKEDEALNRAQRGDLKENYKLESEYSSIKQDVKRHPGGAFKARTPGFSFFSFLEKKAGETG